MALVLCESGTDATQDFSFYHTITGTVESATDQSHTGGRSLKLSTGSPAVSAVAFPGQVGVMSDTGRRVSFWVRFSARPTSGSSQYFAINNSGGGGGIHQLRLSSQGQIVQLIFGTPANATVTGTQTLSLNTWHRITCAYAITSATNFTFRVYVDGVLDSTLTYTTDALIRVGSNTLACVLEKSFPDNTDAWFDDIYIDDGTDLGDPGDIRVTAKRPLANGGTNSFDTTTSTTSSGYGTGNSVYVNERPLATTGARRHNASGGSVAETFQIEGPATGDVDLSGSGTVHVGRLSWVHGSGVSTDTIYSNGSASVPGTAFSGSAAVRWVATDATTYPTSASVCGMGRPTGDATDAILNECGVLFAYKVARKIILTQP